MEPEIFTQFGKSTPKEGRKWKTESERTRASSEQGIKLARMDRWSELLLLLLASGNDAITKMERAETGEEKVCQYIEESFDYEAFAFSRGSAASIG